MIAAINRVLRNWRERNGDHVPLLTLIQIKGTAEVCALDQPDDSVVVH